MENECTSHNFIVLAIFAPKSIKVGGNLTKFWRKQFWLFFETRCRIPIYYTVSQKAGHAILCLISLANVDQC